MIDFFSYVYAKLNDDLFFIKDDHGQTPVKLIYSDSADKDCVKVVNDLRENVEFIPVDHNIPLKRIDDSDDEICDVLLVTGNRLSFIEIKDVRDGWRPKAKSQVESTIKHFDVHHSNDRRKRQAFLCNVSKNLEYKHNFIFVSEKEVKEEFFTNYKARLYISNDVYV